MWDVNNIDLKDTGIASLNVTAKLETKHVAKGGSEIDVVKDELELSAVQTPSLFGMIMYWKYWSIHIGVVLSLNVLSMFKS